METSGISFVDLRNGEEDDEDGMFVIPVDIDKPISLCQDLRSFLSTSNVHEKLNSDLALILGEYQLLLVNGAAPQQNCQIIATEDYVHVHETYGGYRSRPIVVITFI